jgi:hypothetical protein
LAFKLIGQHGQSLPIVPCDLSHDPATWTASGTAPKLENLSALVDTGATHLVTTPQIIASLNLPFVRNIDNAVVGGVNVCRAYACQVTLFGTDTTTGGPMDSHTTGALILEQTLSGYDVILGWDILQFYDLDFRREGSFIITGH